MEIGDCFQSLEEAEQKIVAYMQENFHPVRKIHSQSVKSYNKKVKTKFLPEDIQVYTITWVCKHTGVHRPRISKGTRKRVALALDCPFKLTITYNLLRQLYVINNFNKTHNHAIGEELFKSYATSRRPDRATKAIMEQMLQLGGNTTVVAALAHAKGAMVTPKDVMNMKQKIRARTKTIEVGDMFDNHVLSNPELVFEILKNRTHPDVIEAIFLSSKKHILEAKMFPEVMILDNTYTDNKFLWPLYVVLVIDDDLIARPVAYCIVPNLNGRLNEFLSWWKSQLSEFPQCFFTEKNLSEVKCLKREFANTFVALSRFSCVNEVRNFLDTSPEITPDISENCLSLFQELLYTTSNLEHDSVITKITAISQPFTEYIDKEWTPYTKEFAGFSRRWVLHLDFTHENDRLQHFRSIFNDIFDQESSDSTFTFLIESIIELLKNDSRENRLENMEISCEDVPSDIVDYKTDYSSFVVNEIIKEYERLTDFEVEPDPESSGYLVKHPLTNKVQEVDEFLICPCIVAVCFGLCCRHVFAIQKQRNETMFLPDIIHKRWKAKLDEPDVEPMIAQISEINTNEEQNRYNYALKECEDFCRWLSTLSEKDFEENFEKFVQFKNRVMGCQSSDDHDYTRSQPENDSTCTTTTVIPESYILLQVDQDQMAEFIESTSVETICG